VPKCKLDLGINEIDGRMLAIDIQKLSKCFHLYRSPLDRLKEALHPLHKKFYHDFYALREITLAIPFGQTLGIIGLNGSGKSTLLKLICGILQPTEGKVVVNGNISALLELGSGFNPEFTGRQNVYFAGALAGVDRHQMNKCFAEIEAFAEIGDFIDQPTKNYSSGMLMRLAFAVAVNIKPDILIVDEALAVGDNRFQHKCMAKIKSFQANSTIIMVSHDQNAILTLCDRVAWLHEGKLLAVGNPKEIMEQYTQLIYEGVDSVIGKNADASDLGGKEPTLGKSKSFGTGKARISRVRLYSRERGETDVVFGGESVMLDLWVEAFEVISKPIVGFLVKNRLGIELFGENNLTLEKSLPTFKPGKSIKVSFCFSWPRLAAGSYAVTVAVADGTLEVHHQQHWIHDMLMVEVVQERKDVGLFSLEQVKIEVAV